MLSNRSRFFERYVAIGDSSTEGIDDPDGLGGYRGWSQRLAEKISVSQGGLHYANLAARGLTTAQVRESQLEPALALRPNLATLFCGTNDVTQLRFDPIKVAKDIETMQRALVSAGATVVSFTLPDLTPVMPLARLIAPRIVALNFALLRAAQATGTILVDFAAYPVATDARLWSEDRIHANAEGHARIAEALFNALDFPGATTTWNQPFPTPLKRSGWQRLSAELPWIRVHLAPWIWEGWTDRDSVLRRPPKRPKLAPV